jgi:MFS family permease
MLTQSLFANRKIFRGWWILIACSIIGAYGGGVYFYGFTMFFNPLKDELGLTSAQTSIVFSLTRLEGAFEGALVGFLIDRYGSRKIMTIGIPVAGIGFLIWSTLVNSYTSFLLVYVGIIAMGINGGFFHPAMAVANNWFVRKRSTAMAIISVSVGIGGSIIVPVLGFIINGWGWRQAAFIAGVGMIFVVWPLTMFIRHRPEDVGLLPDGDYDATLTTKTEGDSSGQSEIYIEESSFTVTEAFRTRSMWLLICAITLRFTSHTAIMVHLAPILQDRGMGTLAAGGAVGWLGDRYAKRKVIALLLILQFLSLIILAQSTSIWNLYLFIVLWAFSYGAGILNWAIVGDYFGRARFATLRGLMGLIYSTGAVIGPIYAGWVFDNKNSYIEAIWVFTAITACAIFFYWIAAPPKQNQNIYG